MNGNTRTVVAIKAQISKFSGIISKGISKPKRRLIKEMLYQQQDQASQAHAIRL